MFANRPNPSSHTVAVSRRLAHDLSGFGRLRHYLQDQSAATAIEYGIIVAGIAIAIVVIVFSVGESLENLFTTIQTWLDSRS